MTDEEMANAVVSGLARTHRCECGVIHQLGESRKNWVNCKACGRHRAHNDRHVYCRCGATSDWGPKAQWRVTSRNAKCWKAREANFRARIAELEFEAAVRR